MTGFSVNDRRGQPKGDPLSRSRLTRNGMSVKRALDETASPFGNPSRRPTNDETLGHLGRQRPRGSMRRQGNLSSGSMGNPGSLQMATGRPRDPMFLWRQANLPFNFTEPAELQRIREFCNTPDAPITMADGTFKPLSNIVVGDSVQGWNYAYQRSYSFSYGNNGGRTRHFLPSTVRAISTRTTEVVQVTLASGAVIKCTPDHYWYNPYYGTQVNESSLYPIDFSGPTTQMCEEYRKFEIGTELYDVTNGRLDKVIDITSLGESTVIALQTSTGNYIAWNYASRNCRLLYVTHPLIAACIDVFSKYPLQGLNFVSKDPQLVDFYSELFFDQLDYESHLLKMGRQFWLSGETWSLGAWNDTLGIWEGDELINPDNVEVEDSLFLDQPRFLMRLPESLRKILSNRTPRWQYEQLVSQYPELLQYTAQDALMPVSNYILKQLKFDADDFSNRGIPILMRGFRTIIQEEMLNCALDSICVVAGTPILTRDGVSYVEDVQKGDEVLTHAGRYRQVLRTMTRQADEPGVAIRFYYDRPLVLTGEHPVLVHRKLVQPGVCYYCRIPVRPADTVCEDHSRSEVYETKGGQRRHRKGWCCICGDLASPRYVHCEQHRPDLNDGISEGWVKAKDVSLYDCVWHPGQPGQERKTVSIWEHLPKEDWVLYDPADHAYGMTEKEWYQQADMRARLYFRQHVRRKVLERNVVRSGDIVRHNRFGAKYEFFGSEYNLTDDLLWLIGLYVADGCATVHIGQSAGAPPHGTVEICLGTHEVEYQQRALRVIREVFGLSPYLYCSASVPNMTKVVVNNLPLALWLKEMCGVSETKRFPSWGFDLSSEQAATMISGWMHGDGHRFATGVRGTSSHRKRQEQAARLIRRTGYVSQISAADSKWPGATGGGNAGVTSCQVDQFSDLVDMDGDASVSVQSVDPRRAYAPSGSYVDGYWVEVRSVTPLHINEPVFNLEVEEDNSYCAPVAVHNCDRLYTPLILTKLGATAADLGTTVPWIPTADEMEDFNIALDAALAADFRALTYHWAIDMQPVFGRENVPDLSNDFDRIDERLLMIFGLSSTMLTGANSGETYAADALNRDLVVQLLSHHQRQLAKFTRDRMLIVAEAQEHFDYEVRNGKRYLITEEVYEIDEETGVEKIVQQPKLLVPELEFAALNLTDAESERQFVEALAESGIPISYRARVSTTGMDFDEQIEASSTEKVALAVAEQETRKKTYLALQAKGLPIPDDLMEDFSPKAIQMGAEPPRGISNDGVLPALGQEPQDLPALAPTEDDLDQEEGDPNAENAVPSDQDADMDGQQDTEEQDPDLPQEGDDVPPESNEQRGRMPKPAKLIKTAAIPKLGIRQATRLNYVPPDNSEETNPSDYRPSGRFGGPRHIGMRRYVSVPDELTLKAYERDHPEEEK